MSEITEVRPQRAKSKKHMLVRCGPMNSLGMFEHNEAQIQRTASRVVVKTEKGLELGFLVGQLGSYRDGRFRFSDDQIEKYFSDGDIEFSLERAGKFIRYATSADIAEWQHLRKIAKEEIECCKRFVKEMDLPMKIVDADHILGGERIVFYFMSDGRVDFRDLVKRLAQEYQTRIEMRQIGSRDEARLLGDIESCGQECCCRRFLQLLKPVNMRMAKMQKATLDPSKISGYCGRLKCCLRYEDATYAELKGQLPKKNTIVKTKHGQGRVVDGHILTQLVVVEYENGEKLALGVDELEIISPASAGKKKKKEVSDDRQDNKEDAEQ